MFKEFVKYVGMKFIIPLLLSKKLADPMLLSLMFLIIESVNKENIKYTFILIVV